MIIERRSLRDEAHEILADWIFIGRLEPGANLDEVSLAKELGISRTPLRESLILLERDGLIEAKVNRGFFVAGLDAGMVAELYPVIAHLDTMALRLAGPPAKDILARMRKLNSEMRGKSLSKAGSYKRDHEWHRLLTAHCPNSTLLETLEALKLKAKRFDGGPSRGMAARRASCREHAAILTQLEAGDTDGAADALENHWLGGIEVVTSWIKQRVEKADSE